MAVGCPYVDEWIAEGAGHDDLAAVLTDSDHPFRLAAALVRLFLTRDPIPHNSTAER